MELLTGVLTWWNAALQLHFWEPNIQLCDREVSRLAETFVLDLLWQYTSQVATLFWPGMRRGGGCQLGERKGSNFSPLVAKQDTNGKNVWGHHEVFQPITYLVSITAY